MTPADRRLGALLAAFAPSRARELASRLAMADPELALRAEWLACAPRRERLTSIAAALAPERAGPRDGPRGVARRPPERPRLAALLEDAVGLRTSPLAPALARLLRERSGSGPG